MKKTLVFVLATFMIYIGYGYFYACCPGVASCGGCNDLRVFELILHGILLMIVAIAVIVIVLINLLRKECEYPDDDVYSTSNPDREDDHGEN